MKKKTCQGAEFVQSKNLQAALKGDNQKSTGQNVYISYLMTNE